MKILLFTNDINKIGGIETSFYNMAQYLRDKGYEVGVRYHSADPFRLNRFKTAGIDIQFAKPETCDILINGSMWGLSQNITAKVTAQQCHADWGDLYWGQSNIAKLAIKANSPKTDIFLPVSQSSANFVTGFTDKPVIPMYNLAPSKSKIKKNKHSGVVFAAFTRMTAEKGLSNYQAFKEHIDSLGIKAEFRVYTNGEAPDGWTAYEPVLDIRTELTDIDFACSLAPTESFGYTIAEANSCGVPCIIKKCNSTPEFFSEDNNVILDNIEDLKIDDLNKKVRSYNLRDKTTKNIDETLEKVIKLADQKCIIRVMRSFNDLQEKRMRHTQEAFSVSKERAKQLLSNKIKIVERL